MKFLRNILIIVVPIYFIIIWVRNVLYDLGIIASRSYDLPIICVGNLSVGGTGKTPMIEYIIRLIQNDYKVATLSRGYKRKSTGFQLAGEGSSAETLGDEPFQFYSKFKSITVSVDGNRRRGIASLLSKSDSPEVILLDDAFQHRKVKAGLNILLTTYDELYVDDMLLPTGNLREPGSGAKRAHIIIVTKCPKSLKTNEKEQLRKKLRVRPHQQLFFSRISYSDFIYGRNTERSIYDLKAMDFTLVTGIANPRPLLDHLKGLDLNFDHLEFNDHHIFSEKELEMIGAKPIVLTTEKDYVRLKDAIQKDHLFYLPIETKLDKGDEFESLIRTFIGS
ncbi:MAG: tetraacyldisaccharide 4'-kinase [Flavobacteriaceae bacterium]|nr:tetraacyldisaccharide 4'-kinase [Flavobacteriaceae bacterium]